MSEPEQEWQDGPLTVEGRLERLERVMRAIREQRTEGFRLAESVDRLGLNAGALQEALLQVDRNQQTLTKLGKELEETKAIVVPREEHAQRDEERSQELAAYRRSVTGKMYAWGVAGLAALLTVGLLLDDLPQPRADQELRVLPGADATTDADPRVPGGSARQQHESGVGRGRRQVDRATWWTWIARRCDERVPGHRQQHRHHARVRLPGRVRRTARHGAPAADADRWHRVLLDLRPAPPGERRARAVRGGQPVEQA